MAKKTFSFVFWFLLIVNTVSACQTQPTPPTLSSNDIVGFWSGKAQWMCGHGDPPWITTIEFKPDESFAMLMTDPNGVTTKGNGTWSLSGNDIEIKLSTNVWSGAVSNGKMEGTFKDDRDSCTGNWSVTKK